MSVFDSDIFNFIKPKNELEEQGNISDNQPFVPDSMWIKCPVCKSAILSSDLADNQMVCPKCNFISDLPQEKELNVQ